MYQPILVRCKDGTYFAPNLRLARRFPLGDDPREPPCFEDMVLWHDRENKLLFVEVLPLGDRPGGETEIIGDGRVRLASPSTKESFRVRREISPDDARVFAEICSKTLPPDFLPERPRPQWDRVQRRLSYQGMLCRHYPRENAENQFTILDAFQETEWPESVDSPFKRDWTLRETTDGLNSGLDSGCPIRFKVVKKRPTWYIPLAPSCSGKSPSSLL